jgi:vancomycin resistance protein YoaR
MRERPSARTATRFSYPELDRPVQRRTFFHQREAQRYLRRKESRWAPFAYIVFLLAILSIFSVAYTTFVFSKYRGEILPGTYVDSLPLSGLTQKQAENLCDIKAASNYVFRPVKLVYNANSWEPKPREIGLVYQCDRTAKDAMNVGRTGSFLAQLVDRLPVHPDHTVPLEYSLGNGGKLQAYVQTTIGSFLSAQPQNARLRWRNGVVTLTKSVPGRQLDVPGTLTEVRTALGYLTQQTRNLDVLTVTPAIRDSDATIVLQRVNRLLNNPPVIAIGKRVVQMTRADFQPMVTFSEAPKKRTVFVNVNPDRVKSYIATLAKTQVDTAPQDAKISFVAGHVQTIQRARAGRSLNQDSAYASLIKVIQGLKPHARLRWTVKTLPPPVDPTNPATLGISTLLSSGTTSFAGASNVRLTAINQIVSHISDTLIQPGQDISFNAIVGTAWLPQAYADDMNVVNGKIVPGDSGAMQQVATTFLRALYGAGLQLTERHSHTYLLPWYSPPYGYDAVVSPLRAWDLTFHNNTGKNLILETDVQPIKQTVSIYVFGPKLGWSVVVDSGKLTTVIPQPEKRIIVDPTLPAHEIDHTAIGLNGGTTVIHRIVTKPDGSVVSDSITSTYQPRAAIDTVGEKASEVTPTATPTPKVQTGKGTPTPGTPTVTPTGTPSTATPTLTATFSH